MKGYMIELRNNNNTSRVLGSGSLSEGATADKRKKMAQRLKDKMKDKVKDSQGFFAIEYEADWTECSHPELVELTRYELE